MRVAAAVARLRANRTRSAFSVAWETAVKFAAETTRSESAPQAAMAWKYSDKGVE